MIKKLFLFRLLLPKKRVAGVLLVVLALTGCQKDEPTMPWDGHWERTLHVPKGRQGRCIDEELMIDKKQWQLRAIVHSTFECNQPFLEILYKGLLPQVQVKRNTDDRQLTFKISEIHLAELVDVAGNDRAVLKGAALKSLSGQYVPSGYQTFDQTALLGPDGNTMKSNIFHPVLSLLTAGDTSYSGLHLYHRVPVNTAKP